MDNFRDFKVMTRGGDAASTDLARALASIGTLDDSGNAWLSVDAVKRLAGSRADDPDWTRSFSAMLEYAARHGFLDEDGRQVQAHCEREGAAS